MTSKMTALMLAGALSAASASLASQAPKPTPSTPATSTQASKPAAKPTMAKPVAPKSMSAVGTLSAYDSASNMVTVTTSKGAQQFSLAPTATIRQGSKKLATADLAGHSGANVKVRYTESGGQMVASSITITSESKGKPKK
ncbi:MAG: hypothetical protein HYS05_07560 [Acidobacteria bacterium]|nr:hypothetical protein [Acidobacteriota bacterium]